jgi:hypothetical protein
VAQVVASTSSVTVIVGPVLLMLEALASAQTTSAVDAPWSGQAQCVLSTKGPDYEDEQIHTWRITSGAPRVMSATRLWPAVWSVRGNGRRVVSSVGRSATPEERWTISIPETSAPIAISEVPGPSGTNRIRIASQHGLLVATNTATPVRASTGETIAPSLQEWLFPTAEDVITSTVISGTRTRTLADGPGWRKPSGVMTTETCTWQFTRNSGSAPPGAVSMIATGSNPNGGALSVNPTQPMKSCTAAPAPTYSATPGGVTFALNRRSKITAYRISRRDLGELTPSAMTALSYTHAAPLEHQTPYEYVVTGMQSDGGCTTASVTVTGPKPLTPQVTARVTVNGPTNRATLSWSAQADRPTSYLVLGAGLPQAGTEVAATSATHSVDTGNLPIGVHGWLVTPLWKTPAGNLIDVSAGARVTATVGNRLGGVVPDSIWDTLTKTMQSYHDMQMAPLRNVR